MDTIEIGMRLAGVETDQPIGLAAYEVAKAISNEELSLGHTIVIDAVTLQVDSSDGDVNRMLLEVLAAAEFSSARVL